MYSILRTEQLTVPAQQEREICEIFETLLLAQVANSEGLLKIIFEDDQLLLKNGERETMPSAWQTVYAVAQTATAEKFPFLNANGQFWFDIEF